MYINRHFRGLLGHSSWVERRGLHRYSPHPHLLGLTMTQVPIRVVGVLPSVDIHRDAHLSKPIVYMRALSRGHTFYGLWWPVSTITVSGREFVLPAKFPRPGCMSPLSPAATDYLTLHIFTFHRIMLYSWSPLYVAFWGWLLSLNQVDIDVFSISFHGLLVHF